MVLVRVREQDGVNVSRTVLEVREIGQDEVDAEVLIPWEREPCVVNPLSLARRSAVA